MKTFRELGIAYGISLIIFIGIFLASQLVFGAGPTPLSTFLGGTGISTTTGANVGYNFYLVSTNASGVPAYGFQANSAGGIASSGSPTAGQWTYWTTPNKITGDANMTINTSTGAITLGTSTVTVLAFTNASGTNIDVSGYGTFPTLNFTNASGTNQTLSGYSQPQKLIVTGTAGQGYIILPAQASNPSSPPTGTLLLHSATTQGFTRLEQDNEATTNLVLGRDNVFIAKNTSGATINPGQAVYVTGSTGNVPNIALAQATSSETLASVAVALDSISNNAFGQVMTWGVISSIDTSAFSTGDRLWVSTSTAGGFTNVRPIPPYYVQRIGSVLVSGVGNGSIMVGVAPAVQGMEAGTNNGTFTVSGISTSTIAGDGTSNVLPNVSSTAITVTTLKIGTLNGLLKGTTGSVGTAANGTDYTLITGTTCGGTDKVSAVAADGTVTCTADTVGSGSFNASTTAGQVIIANYANHGTSTSKFTYTTSTVDMLQVFGLSSSTEVRSPSSTITNLTVPGLANTPLAVDGAGKVVATSTGATPKYSLQVGPFVNETKGQVDSIFTFNDTSTISSARFLIGQGGGVASGTVTFNLGFATSTANPTSSLRYLFTSDQTVSSLTSTLLTVNGSTTANAEDILVYFTTTASSTEFVGTLQYTTP